MPEYKKIRVKVFRATELKIIPSKYIIVEFASFKEFLAWQRVQDWEVVIIASEYLKKSLTNPRSFDYMIWGKRGKKLLNHVDKCQCAVIICDLELETN